MARIAGVNIPTGKRIVVALTYIHGIGHTSSRKICADIGIPSERRVNDLTDDQVCRIRETIDKDFQVEGDLRREVAMNIKRLMDINCYRGQRHRRGLLRAVDLQGGLSRRPHRVRGAAEAERHQDRRGGLREAGAAFSREVPA